MIMFAKAVLLLLFVNSLYASEDVCKNVITIDGVTHETELLLSDLDNPFHLRVDKKRDLLFLSYNLDASHKDYFQLGFLNLKDKKFTKIEEVKNGFSAAIHEDEVYLGGSEGIYTYDDKTNKYVLTNITNNNIWSLISTDHLYFINYPGLKLHKYVDKATILVDKYSEITVKHYDVGKNGTVFYSNDTALYMIDSTTNEEVVLVSDLDVRGISINKFGKAYFATEAGIFTEKDNKFEHVGGEFQAYGIAFDKDDNMIFADTTDVYIVKPRTKESLENLKKCNVAEEITEENSKKKE